MYTLIHNHIRCVDITAGTKTTIEYVHTDSQSHTCVDITDGAKATIEYIHADSQLLLYRRTATYLRCTGIVSWLLREIYSNK